MKVCFVDKTTNLDSLADIEYRARGGMVCSLIKLPDVLSQLGCECYVISDIKSGGVTDHGAIWYTDGQMTDEQKNQRYDFLVYNRQTCNGFSEIKTKYRILWTHDIPHHGFIPDARILNVIDATVFMSGYAERIWRKYFPKIRKSYQIPNGVDKEIFYPRDKDFNKIIFISAPNRGLHRLPMIFEVLRKRVSEKIELYAFSNMSKLHPENTEEGYEGVYQACVDSGIKLSDPIPQPMLAKHLGESSLMILPSAYPEICSNSILQTLISGVPILTNDVGSAGEWIKSGWNGFLTEFKPHDYWVFELELLLFAKTLFQNRRHHKKMIRNATKTPKIYTWEQIGEQWFQMLKQLY